MKHSLGHALLLGAFLAACGERPASVSTAPQSSPAVQGMGKEGGLAAGQVWRYRTRPDETGSTLTILKIESQPTVGKVVHVSLAGLLIRRKGDPSVTWNALPHLKFSEAAIKESITELVGTTAATPGSGEGGDPAQAARGRIFMEPVNEVLVLIERGLDPDSE